MIFRYYVSRYATPAIYTFEFIVSVIIFLFVLYLNLKDFDKKSIWVFLIASALHSITELIAQGVGTRIIEDAYLFNVPINYPITAIIIGFFEGGFIALGAYHFVRVLANKDPLSIKFVIITLTILMGFLLLGSYYMRIQIDSNLSPVTLTRRDIFAPNAIILLIFLFSITITYFSLSKKVQPNERITLLYWYLGLALFSLLLVLPTHIFQVRYIEVKNNGGYAPVSVIEQIIIMYGYNICIEATGFLIYIYIFIYHFDLIEIKKGI
ncbi:MAG: hypothetical protein ACFFDK_06805 [Promethearchaeota archaeon]